PPAPAAILLLIAPPLLRLTHSFPTRRSSDLMLPVQIQQRSWLRGGFVNPVLALLRAGRDAFAGHFGGNGFHFPLMVVAVLLVVVDRKSTRLNSSHQIISYAGFCLNKKRIQI